MSVNFSVKSKINLCKNQILDFIDRDSFGDKESNLEDLHVGQDNWDDCSDGSDDAIDQGQGGQGAVQPKEGGKALLTIKVKIKL
jgi:hypothetical protein